jgi:hypothetical protein
LRPRPRPQRPSVRPGRIRRLHLPRSERARLGLRLDGLPERQHLHPIVRDRLRGSGGLRAAAGWDDLDADAAIHLEGNCRGSQLLRDRREGPELHDHRRLRLHPRSRVRAPHVVRGDDVPGRDHPLLLGRPAGAFLQRDGWGGQPAARGAAELPEAIDAAGESVPRGRACLPRPAEVPVGARLRRAHLPAAGLTGSELREPD